MQEREPQDRAPQYQQPYYPPPQYAYPPAPVVVNVVQNAYGPRPVLVRRRVNHRLHFWLTVLTGGGWGLFVWIPVAIRGGKKVRVYR